jgi:hypothetical protein
MTFDPVILDDENVAERGDGDGLKEVKKSGENV